MYTVARARHGSLSVMRLFGTLAEGGGPFESVYMNLVQFRGDRFVGAELFELEDLDVARARFAHARFVAGESASAPAQVTILALDRALAQRDWLAFRGCLADNLVYRDHRKLGLGNLACDELVAAVRVHRDLATDLRTETRQLLRWSRQGSAAVMHQYGTVPDGGPFENVFLRLIVADGDRIRHFETFDVVDADPARFEDLRIGSTRKPTA
jgi:hypothetical protein